MSYFFRGISEIPSITAVVSTHTNDFRKLPHDFWFDLDFVRDNKSKSKTAAEVLFEGDVEKEKWSVYKRRTRS